MECDNTEEAVNTNKNTTDININPIINNHDGVPSTTCDSHTIFQDKFNSGVQKETAVLI